MASRREVPLMRSAIDTYLRGDVAGARSLARTLKPEQTLYLDVYNACVQTNGWYRFTPDKADKIARAIALGGDSCPA